ncbi:MAG: hypothetical protein LBL01_07070, partial [Bifidobacteriaceae bacterium]|nr:hypothetical protein [Bifidobacteriaceae bacterium]
MIKATSKNRAKSAATCAAAGVAALGLVLGGSLAAHAAEFDEGSYSAVPATAEADEGDENTGGTDGGAAPDLAPVATAAAEDGFTIAEAQPDAAPAAAAQGIQETADAAEASALAASEGSGDGSDVTVLSDGDVRLAYQLVDGELDLSIAQVTDGAATWHDLAETVIQIRNQDLSWPGYAYSEGSTNWRRWETVSAAGSLAYRTAPTAALAKTHVNTLALSWDASLIASSAVYGGVNRKLGGVATDSGGYFATYTAATGTRQWDGRAEPPAYLGAPTNLAEWVATNASASGELAATVAPTGFLFSEPG